MSLRTILFIVMGLLLLYEPLDSLAQSLQEATGSGIQPTGEGSIDAGKANNPAEPLAQVQIQSWYHPAYDGMSGQGNDLILRPIVPFGSVGIIPSSIIRLQLPLTSTPNGRTGVGDIQLIAFAFPGWHPDSRFKVGIAPVITAPSATNRYAGQGQWQVGPASIFIFTGVKKLVLGVIADNPITVTGERSRPGVNALTLQPLVIKTLAKGYFVRFDPYWNFDWKEHGSATLPLNLGFGRLIKIRGQLVNAFIQPEFLARNEGYAGSHPPRVTLRFAMALVYPEKSAKR